MLFLLGFAPGETRAASRAPTSLRRRSPIPPRARTCATRDPRPDLSSSANARLTLPRGRSTCDAQADAKDRNFPNAARLRAPCAFAHRHCPARRAPTEKSKPVIPNPKIIDCFGCEYLPQKIMTVYPYAYSDKPSDFHTPLRLPRARFMG